MVKQDSEILDYSDSEDVEGSSLSRDRIPIRSMEEGDLPAIVRIDRKVTGRDRTTYYERKFKEVMGESGVRVSLVAEVDAIPAGFIMARVDFGEFGKTEPAAVIDTIGVDPIQSKKGVGQALLSQLLINLSALRIETVRTIVPWDNFQLLNFLKKKGFAPSQRLLLTKPVI